MVAVDCGGDERPDGHPSPREQHDADDRKWEQDPVEDGARPFPVPRAAFERFEVHLLARRVDAPRAQRPHGHDLRKRGGVSPGVLQSVVAVHARRASLRRSADRRWRSPRSMPALAARRPESTPSGERSAPKAELRAAVGRVAVRAVDERRDVVRHRNERVETQRVADRPRRDDERARRRARPRRVQRVASASAPAHARTSGTTSTTPSRMPSARVSVARPIAAPSTTNRRTVGRSSARYARSNMAVTRKTSSASAIKMPSLRNSIG